MHIRRLTTSIVALLVLLLTLAPATAQEQTFQPLVTCRIDQVQAAFAGVQPYTPSGSQWVAIQGDQFIAGGTPFYVQGVNYYPARFPWRKFLTETDTATIERELDLIAGTGLNTIRVYLWNDALFQCPGSGAIPVPAAFARLDTVIRSAAQRGLHVIMSLNDMPDLEAYPLYFNPAHVQAQTAYLVTRYRDEAAILAWDMRNAGDLDYGSDNNMQGQFSRETVLSWLGQTYAQIKAIDPRHPITAGWAFDNEATIPYVDFVSYAYWDEDMNVLGNRTAVLTSATDKPVVLASFGYASFERSEDDQARLISGAVQVTEQFDAGGWVLWTAFDFPLDATCVQPACPSPDSREHHFGLWRADYTPKPALAAIAVG